MEPYSVFAHLTSPKVEDYRRVMAVFSRARSEFVIHLRPAELARATGIPDEQLEPVLDQLSEWGNLDRSRDHVDAASIEEFYRVKWLYQLSARGEAAERALDTFERSVHEAGELQSEALRDIIEYLEAIRRLLPPGTTPASADFSKLHQHFEHLETRFERFTEQAQRFMRFLQSTIELHGLSLEDFIAYKDRLIDYLQRFVNDLITSASEIERKLAALDRAGVRQYFEGIARRARADALDPDDVDMLAAELDRRDGRWDGLRRWFLGAAHERSQAETLRTRTREAIPALLVALQSFHDRRESGSDRHRDWRELAHWFAEAPDDAAAHRLWRVAFALAPARHLRINEETLDCRDQAREDPRVSWLEAEPMWLEPQLRQTGRTARTGRAPALVDLSAERDLLRRLAAEENAQIARAHELLANNHAMWLSDLGKLEPAAFHLLLDLLGRALAATAGLEPDQFPVAATSTDGSLCIELTPPPDPNRLATIHTSEGRLTGPDYGLTIRLAANLAPPIRAA